MSVKWLDARQLITTNQDLRKAEVDWDNTLRKVKEAVMDEALYLTLGFIAGTEGALMTTLGREGSDFTAAIFGKCLDA